jgi:hypothetical protein
MVAQSLFRDIDGTAQIENFLYVVVGEIENAAGFHDYWITAK